MATTNSAIEVSGLKKNYGHAVALNGLDLRVETGEVAGFLGPNGAGKSTTIRILLGLLKADGGVARMLGRDPWKDAVSLHRDVAYVPGEVNLWPNLTGGQAISILSKLHGSFDTRRQNELLERFELDPTKKARSYSKGNRQKVALVAALSSNAELLLLDEPTSGLDPLMEQVFTSCIREEAAQGRSVLLSSHIFSEVEKLCDTVTIIRDGQTVEAGALAELRHLQRTQISVEIAANAGELSAITGIEDLEVAGTSAKFSVDQDQLPSVLSALATYAPRNLVSAPPSLEELFLRHYSDNSGRPVGVRAGEQS
ncbi:ABC transporter ATP-binding protein [Arthrobacter sp. NIO-1057]|uniref:ABC transporter ATP-binding protein n=1 Tax=Arthrobacter sp. NIO-1057 TaxID=993071 RepID=UPI00071C7DFE|nr:ABC transporter ATP-binding protein [Arthrobacter sp. NIO-1057]KSU68002.1 hypothetical protein AS038_02610 [Arthrobacter sp. NIO-1057]SCB85675.1 ABC-2 type transport system ATP-binding protein [Arthrobacter sp. NIO-1057]